MNTIRKEKTTPENYPTPEPQTEKPAQEPTPYPEYIGPQLKVPENAPEPEISPAKPFQRSTANLAGSMIFFIIGITGLCVSVFLLLLSASLILGAIDTTFLNSIPFVNGVIGGTTASISLELLLLVLSTFHFVAGNWLLQSLKRGGILGFTISSFNIVISILVIAFFPALSTLAYIVIVISALLLLTVIVGWNSLQAKAPVVET